MIEDDPHALAQSETLFHLFTSTETTCCLTMDFHGTVVIIARVAITQISPVGAVVVVHVGACFSVV